MDYPIQAAQYVKFDAFKALLDAKANFEAPGTVRLLHCFPLLFALMNLLL